MDRQDCAYPLVAAGLLFLGALAGSHGQDNTWERRLVDEPATIQAITSRVLAERAEEKARR